MSDKQNLLEYVDQFMVQHRAWQADHQRPIVDDRYHQTIRGLLAATEGDFPPECRAIISAIHRFYEAFNDYFVIASAPGFDPAMGTAWGHEQQVWGELEKIEDLRKLYDESDPHMPSVAELREQKVSDDQISRMWGIPLAMVEGILTGNEKLRKDHLRPDQLEMKRVRAAKLRDANLEADQIASTIPTDRPVCGERLDDLIYQKISATQICMMRPADYPTVTEPQVQIRAGELGIQLPEYGTVSTSDRAHDEPHPAAAAHEEAFAATRREDREPLAAEEETGTPPWPASDLETFVVDQHKDGYGALKSGAVVQSVKENMDQEISVQKVNGIMGRWKDVQEKVRLQEKTAGVPA